MPYTRLKWDRACCYDIFFGKNSTYSAIPILLWHLRLKCGFLHENDFFFKKNHHLTLVEGIRLLHLLQDAWELLQVLQVPWRQVGRHLPAPGRKRPGGGWPGWQVQVQDHQPWQAQQQERQPDVPHRRRGGGGGRWRRHGLRRHFVSFVKVIPAFHFFFPKSSFGAMTERDFDF